MCRSFGTDEDLLIVPCLASSQSGGVVPSAASAAAASGVDQDRGSHHSEASILPGINLRNEASMVATQ